MNVSTLQLLGFTLILCGDENQVVSLMRTETSPTSLHPSHTRWVMELNEYAQGIRTQFDWPIDLTHATAFQHRVFAALQTIPFGNCETYGGVAKHINQPQAARGVGQAVGKNPVLIVIPCHRVVAAHGLGGFSCGLDLKEKLLEHESQYKRECLSAHF